MFSSVAYSETCPMGYLQYSSGNFLVLGECESNAGDGNDYVSSSFECNAKGTELKLRTYAKPDCMGFSKLLPYVLKSEIEGVFCSEPKPEKTRNLVKRLPSFAIQASPDLSAQPQRQKCQWAQFRVWEVDEIRADACESETDGSQAKDVALTLPIGMCMSANNDNARDLTGEKELDGLYWKVSTEDCREFVANVFSNKECSEQVSGPKSIITEPGALPISVKNGAKGQGDPIKGLCFDTLQCKVDGVELEVKERSEVGKTLINGHAETGVTVVYIGMIVAIVLLVLGCIGFGYWHKKGKQNADADDVDQRRGTHRGTIVI